MFEEFSDIKFYEIKFSGLLSLDLYKTFEDFQAVLEKYDPFKFPGVEAQRGAAARAIVNLSPPPPSYTPITFGSMNSYGSTTFTTAANTNYAISSSYYTPTYSPSYYTSMSTASYYTSMPPCALSMGYSGINHLESTHYTPTWYNNPQINNLYENDQRNSNTGLAYQPSISQFKSDTSSVGSQTFTVEIPSFYSSILDYSYLSKPYKDETSRVSSFHVPSVDATPKILYDQQEVSKRFNIDFGSNVNQDNREIQETQVIRDLLYNIPMQAEIIIDPPKESLSEFASYQYHNLDLIRIAKFVTIADYNSNRLRQGGIRKKHIYEIQVLLKDLVKSLSKNGETLYENADYIRNLLSTNIELLKNSLKSGFVLETMIKKSAFKSKKEKIYRIKEQNIEKGRKERIKNALYFKKSRDEIQLSVKRFVHDLSVAGWWCEDSKLYLYNILHFNIELIKSLLQANNMQSNAFEMLANNKKPLKDYLITDFNKIFGNNGNHLHTKKSGRGNNTFGSQNTVDERIALALASKDPKIISHMMMKEKGWSPGIASFNRLPNVFFKLGQIYLAKDGVGIRIITNQEDIIMMQGRANSRFEFMRYNFVKITINKISLGRDGEEIKNFANMPGGFYSPESYIPLQEWLHWSDWNGNSLKADEVFSIIMANFDLNLHEGGSYFGHAIAKHVGKSSEWLKNRFVLKPTILGSTSFPDLATANKYTRETLLNNKEAIVSWLSSGKLDTKAFTSYFQCSVGYGYDSNKQYFNTINKVNVVLVKENNGFKIVTSYPLI